MRNKLQRRVLLRGLGGACVAAPFLSSIHEKTLGAQAARPQQRLIVMFTHFGCITTRFFPTKSHGPLTADDLGGTTLRHLAPYVGKLLMPRGIRAMNEWTPTLLRGQGNDPHTQTCGSYFTCDPITPNSDDPFSFNAATRLDAMPVGPSLDHVIARQKSPGKTPLYLRVGNQTSTPQTGISYAAAETPYAGLGTPAQVFSTLTGLFSDGALSPDSYQAQRGKSVIDLVRDDLDTLERSDMSKADRNKLEAWKALLDDTGTALGSAQCSAETAALLGATQANLDAVGSADPMVLSDPVSTKLTDTLDGADIYASVAALAAVCNANPVIVLNFPGSYVYQGLGLTMESHALSHRIAKAGSDGFPCPSSTIRASLRLSAREPETLRAVEPGMKPPSRARRAPPVASPRMLRGLPALVVVGSASLAGCAARGPDIAGHARTGATSTRAPAVTASGSAAVDASADAGEPNDAAADDELTEWGRTACAEGGAGALVARAVPGRSDQVCYRYPAVRDDPCERKVTLRVANCAPFAREAMRVTERYVDYGGSSGMHVWEFEGIGAGSAVVLPVPVPPAEQPLYRWVNRPPPAEHHYRVRALAAGHPDDWAEVTAVVRDPVFEAAQVQYCEPLPEVEPAEPAPQKDRVELTLDRSTCFGPCPSYRVSVRADGTVSYEGRSDVRVVGRAVVHIPAADALALIARFDTAASAAPAPVDPRRYCVGPNPDAPRVRITLSRGRREQPLPLKGHCNPPQEQELAEEIDRVARTERWVTGSKECRDRGLW